MNPITRIVAALAVSVLMTTAFACGDAAPASDKESSPGTAAAQPSERSMVEVLAPIDSVRVEVAESYPPQYFLNVESGLPNGCVVFNDYEVTRDGNTVMVRVTNLAPADKGVICATVYGTVETRIPLGSDFPSTKPYTVDVNGLTTTLKAGPVVGLGSDDADGGYPAPSGRTVPKGYVEEEASIGSVQIEVVPGPPTQAHLIVVSRLESSCDGFGNYRNLIRDGDTIRVEVTSFRKGTQRLVAPPDGSAHYMEFVPDSSEACTPGDRTIEARIPREGDIEACKIYTVEVNGLPPPFGLWKRVQAQGPDTSCKSPD